MKGSLNFNGVKLTNLHFMTYWSPSWPRTPLPLNPTGLLGWEAHSHGAGPISSRLMVHLRLIDSSGSLLSLQFWLLHLKKCFKKVLSSIIFIWKVFQDINTILTETEVMTDVSQKRNWRDKTDLCTVSSLQGIMEEILVQIIAPNCRVWAGPSTYLGKDAWPAGHSPLRARQVTLILDQATWSTQRLFLKAISLWGWNPLSYANSASPEDLSPYNVLYKPQELYFTSLENSI